MNKKVSIGVAFITHEAKKHLPYCLPPLLSSPQKPRVVVVNSSSGDGSVELAQEMGAETLVIPRHEFNHGTSREKVRKFLNTDIIVLMTPDAYAVNNRFLEPLIEPLLEGKASISYARQIPHEGASFFESFSRLFNYPAQSHIRSLADIKTYGVYAFFCSNACAAYVNSALDELGGFPAVLFGEDTITAAKLLRSGHKIAYTAEAMVRHSHDYSLKQEFKRHFDIGMVRKEHQHLLSAPGSDSRRGRQYLLQLMQSAAKFQGSLLPYAVLHIASKWMGYRLGRLCYKAPVCLKKLFSSQGFYWNNQRQH